MYIKKGAITADRRVLAYIRFDVRVPDEDRRQIAQKFFWDILMHNKEGDFTSVRSVLLYVRDEV